MSESLSEFPAKIAPPLLEKFVALLLRKLLFVIYKVSKFKILKAPPSYTASLFSIKLFYMVIIVDSYMYITPASSPALFLVNLFP